MALVELMNSFCADCHERLASVLRNTVWVQSDMSVTEFRTLFACEDGIAAEAETGLLRCRRCRRMRTVSCMK
jgi:hypothetical protein